MNIFEELKYYFQFDFVKYAIIVGILISLCCAMLGVTLVLKRYSMIGDGLSHVAFGLYPNFEKSIVLPYIHSISMSKLAVIQLIIESILI